MKPIDQLSDDELGQALHRAVQALPDAPAALQRAALALFPAQAVTVRDVAASALRLVQAVLSFDSWATPSLAAGMRSGGAATRHLLFTAQGRDIDLRISASSAEAFVLAGQILGPDEHARVRLAPHGGPPPAAQDVVVDELGEFRIDGVRRGTYLLTLDVGSDQIVLPPIEVDDCRN